jgi:di/tricarboxylate transporter
VPIWYGGFITLAEALGKTDNTEMFAQAVASYTAGWA